MPFYDSYPKYSKCCCFNLNIGCVILGILSLLLRILIYVLQKYPLAQNAFDERASLFETIIIVFDVVIVGAAATAADILLILGAVRRHQKYVEIYLQVMFVVFILEFLLFLVWFVLGYHWIEILDYFLYSGFHAFCWFTAHSLNQNWKEVFSVRSADD
uniref:CSON004993 protein n=1 Tax=Culicoides sonorensis TaxID=179676 RepID=A0A336MRV6_CULSO